MAVGPAAAGSAPRTRSMSLLGRAGSPSAKSRARGQPPDRVGDRVDQQLHGRHRRRRASRASRLTTAARLPPALSPPTAIRRGSAPSSAALSAAQLKAAQASSTGGRERVLGGQPVVDREHRGPGRRGEEAAERRRGCRGRRSPSRRRGSRRAAAAGARRERRRGRRGGPGSVRLGRGSRSPRPAPSGSAAAGVTTSTLRPGARPAPPRAAVHRAAKSLPASSASRSSTCDVAGQHLPVDLAAAGRTARRCTRGGSPQAAFTIRCSTAGRGGGGRPSASQAMRKSAPAGPTSHFGHSGCGCSVTNEVDGGDGAAAAADVPTRAIPACLRARGCRG